MTASWTKLKEWWDQLALREQRAISMGGVLIAVFIFYQGIGSPSLHHLEVMRQKIVSAQKTLWWMQSADKVIRSHLSVMKPPPVSPLVFLSQMHGQIKLAGLESFLTELKQSGNDSVEMHFQKIEFDKLAAFLIRVMKASPVTISQLSVSALEARGLVNAELVIK